MTLEKGDKINFNIETTKVLELHASFITARYLARTLRSAMLSQS